MNSLILKDKSHFIKNYLFIKDFFMRYLKNNNNN